MIINNRSGYYQAYTNKVVSFKNNAIHTEQKRRIHVFKSKKGEIIKEFPDRLHEYYNKRNVIVLGSSRSTPDSEKTLRKVEKIAKELALRGYNIVTGAGDCGVMGAAITGAYNAINLTDRRINWNAPEHVGASISVVTQGGWGDEDLNRSTPISMAVSGDEHERVKIFNDLLENPHSAVIIAEPGATTLQEATTLIAMNKYRKKGTPPNRIFLLGKDNFEGLQQQYARMYSRGNFPTDPYDKNSKEKLFEVIEPDKILEKFPDTQDEIN